MARSAWLTRDTIPTRQKFVINLPNDTLWLADFLGALLPLTQEENWEEYGALSPIEQSDEWRAIFLEFEQTMELAIPVGTITAFAGASAPDGWLLCDGTAVSRTTYAALFALINSWYGAGNGSTTFNLPNLVGRVPVGRDASDPNFDYLGEFGGESEHQLLVAEMPIHTHIQDDHNHTQNSHAHAFQSRQRGTVNTGNAGEVERGDPSLGLAANLSVGNTTATNIASAAVNQNAGGSGYHNNLQPYLTLNYIIKY